MQRVLKLKPFFSNQLVTASAERDPRRLEPSYVVLLKQSSALVCLKPAVA